MSAVRCARIAVVLAVLWAGGAGAACDRQCLTAISDQYIGALLKHSPAGLTLHPSLRITENTATVSPGEGMLWRALTHAPTGYRINVIDTASQQIAVTGLWEVDGRQALVALRLKVSGERIVEVEQLFTEQIQPPGLPNLRQARPAFSTPVPPAQRNDRGAMLRIVDAYFDALTSEDSRRAAIGADCVRHEGGIRTTGNPTPLALDLPPNTPAEARERMTRLIRGMSMKNCAEQIDSGLFADLARIWPRRIAVIDEELGLVAAFPMFINTGDIRPSPLKGYPGVDRLLPPLPANSQKMEIFKVHSGQIHEIEAPVSLRLQYGTANGWDADSGQ